MTATTITRNEQYNSFEIAFDGIPDNATRETLKANGYRWHGQRKIWYGYKDIADQLNGAQIESDSPKKQNSDTEKEQQRLINQYAEIYGRDNKKDVDYMRSSTAAVVLLEDGKMYAIEKPSIKKNFCFSRDCNGIPSADAENNADAMAEHARTNADYFLTENLHPLLSELKKFDTEAITDKDDYYLQRYKYKKPYIYGSKYGNGTEQIAYIQFFADWEEDEIKKATADGARLATIEEIKDIIAAYKVVIEQFKKRLASYLKKYGLEKLRIWTYYSD